MLAEAFAPEGGETHFIVLALVPLQRTLGHGLSNSSRKSAHLKKIFLIKTFQRFDAIQIPFQKKIYESFLYVIECIKVVVKRVTRFIAVYRVGRALLIAIGEPFIRFCKKLKRCLPQSLPGTNARPLVLSWQEFFISTCRTA